MAKDSKMEDRGSKIAILYSLSSIPRSSMCSLHADSYLMRPNIRQYGTLIAIARSEANNLATMSFLAWA